MDSRLFIYGRARCPRCAIGCEELPDDTGDAQVSCRHCSLRFCFFCSGALIDDYDEYRRGKEMARESKYAYSFGHHAKVFSCGVGRRDLYTPSRHFCNTTYNTEQQRQNLHRILTFLPRPNNSCLPGTHAIPWLEPQQYIRARIVMNYRKYRDELGSVEFDWRFSKTRYARHLPWLRDALQLKQQQPLQETNISGTSEDFIASAIISL